MSKQKDRWANIVEYLKASGGASIRELAEVHDVSMMTIRRDLESLKDRRLVKFFHGGATLEKDVAMDDTEQDTSDYLIQDQKEVRKEEKIRIAKEAVRLVEPQQTVMLDSGTTIFYLAREIGKNTCVTVVCWSLNVIEVLTKRPCCTLISSGGIYHPETQMFESNQGMEIISSTRASIAFISAGGVHAQLGVTSPFPYETLYKKTALHSSTISVLLVDSTKFGRVCTSHVGEIGDFDVVITDSKIDDKYREDILSRGVRLIVV